MARTSFSDIFYSAAPEAKARDDAAKQLNAELEGANAPAAKPVQPGAWRLTAPGTMVRDDPVSGTTTTIENRGGNVYSKIDRYTPPPVDEKKSYAEILIADIPKRIDLINRKLMAGDIKDAERERAEVDKFIEGNRAELHKFTRYTGRDPLTVKAAETAMGLATGTWLNDQQKALFDPLNNPRSVQGWAAKAGASPRLAELMESARNGSVESNAVLRAAGADFRSVVGTEQQVDDTGKLKPAGNMAPISPSELDAFVKFHDTLTSSIMPNLPQNSLTPDDMAGFSKKLFSASKDGNPAALGAMTRSFSGVLPTDDPETVKTKLRSGMEAATAVAGVAATKSQAAKAMLPAIADAIDSIAGGATRVSGSAEQLRNAADRALTAVDREAVQGRQVSQSQVSRLARIEYSREISDPTILKDPEEQKIASQLQTAAGLRTGLTTTDDPRSQLEQTRVIDPKTNREYIRTASPDEAYPGLAVVKTAMDDTLSRAEAFVGMNGGSIVDAMQANRGRIASILSVPPGQPGLADEPSREKARDAAANMMIRYWSTEGRADMRTIYDDMYKKYHVDVDKASVDDTQTALASGSAAAVYAVADRASKAASGYDAQLYEFFSGRGTGGKLDVEGWDWKQGSQQWNQAVKFTEGLADRVTADATGYASPVAKLLASTPVKQILSKQDTGSLVEKMAAAIESDLKSKAAKLTSSVDLSAASVAVAKQMLENARNYPELASGASDENTTFGMRFPTESEYSAVMGWETPRDIEGSATASGHFGRKALAKYITAGFLGRASGKPGSPSIDFVPPSNATLAIVPAVGGILAPAYVMLNRRTLAESAASIGENLRSGLRESPTAARVLSAPFDAVSGVLKAWSDWDPLQKVDISTTVTDVGLGRNMRDYVVSLMGAPQVKPPASGTQQTVGPRVQPVGPEPDLLSAVSEDMLKQMRAKAASMQGFYAGGAIDWNLSGDQIVAGMNVLKSTTDAAKRPVEDNIVRSILSEMKSDPEAYELAQAASARVRGPLTRSVALKIKSDAKKLAEYGRAVTKGASDTNRLITQAKIKALMDIVDGDEESGTPGLSPEEVDAKLEEIRVDAGKRIAQQQPAML